MNISAERKREVLRKLGYMRQDRTSQGKHRELWVNREASSNVGKSLESCWSYLTRNGFVYVCRETGRISYHNTDNY